LLSCPGVTSSSVASDFLEVIRFFLVLLCVVASSVLSSAGDVTSSVLLSTFTAADGRGNDDVTGAEDDDIRGWPRASSASSSSVNGRISSSTFLTDR